MDVIIGAVVMLVGVIVGALIVLVIFKSLGKVEEVIQELPTAELSTIRDEDYKPFKKP